MPVTITFCWGSILNIRSESSLTSILYSTKSGSPFFWTYLTTVGGCFEKVSGLILISIITEYSILFEFILLAYTGWSA